MTNKDIRKITNIHLKIECVEIEGLIVHKMTKFGCCCDVFTGQEYANEFIITSQNQEILYNYSSIKDLREKLKSFVSRKRVYQWFYNEFLDDEEFDAAKIGFEVIDGTNLFVEEEC